MLSLRFATVALSLSLVVLWATPSSGFATISPHHKRLFSTVVPLDRGVVQGRPSFDKFQRWRAVRSYQPWLSATGVALAKGDRLLVVASPDTDQVIVYRTQDMQKVASVPVSGRPERVVVGLGGRVFVTARQDSELVVIDLAKQRVTQRLGAGVEPLGLGLSPDRRRVYVTAGASQELLAYDAVAPRLLYRRPIVAPWPGPLTAHPRNGLLYIGHGRALQGDHVTVMRAKDGAERQSIALLKRQSGPERLIASGFGQTPSRRTPGHVTALTVSPDGTRLYVAHTAHLLDSPKRPQRGYGSGSNPVSIGLTTIRLPQGKVLRARAKLSSFRRKSRLKSHIRNAVAKLHDLDPPSALVAHPRRAALIGAFPADDRLIAYHLGAASPLDAPMWYRQLPGSPSAIAISRDGRHLYGRTDLGFRVFKRSLRSDGTPDIPTWPGSAAKDPMYAKDPLPVSQRVGRRFLTTGAPHTPASAIACTTCHPDGRTDGLTWPTPVGPRQTPMLAGRFGHRQFNAPHRYNATGAAHTFMKNLQETLTRIGSSSPSEDQARSLFTYIQRHLIKVPSPSPHSPQNPSLAMGRRLFHDDKVGCSDCHPPSAGFTDGLAHTLNDPGATAAGRPTSLNTPSLRGLWASAPYLHDGRAPTLQVLFSGPHADLMGRVSHLDDAQRAALVAYLKTL